MTYKLRVYKDLNGMGNPENLLEEKELPQRLFVDDWVLGKDYQAIVQQIVFNGYQEIVCNATVWPQELQKEVD